MEGLRQLNGVVAGAAGMPWLRFVVFNVIGAALWASVWSTVGYVAGDHWEAITGVVHRYEPYVLPGIVLAGPAVLWWRLRHHDRRRNHHLCQGDPRS